MYETFQDSLVDIDEADDIDINHKLKFIHIFIFPFNRKGVRLVSVSTKRFGSIFYGLFSENKNKEMYIVDEVSFNDIEQNNESLYKIKKVGVKKLLHGVLTLRTRTAAYQYDLLVQTNQLEPKEMRNLGIGRDAYTTFISRDNGKRSRMGFSKFR